MEPAVGPRPSLPQIVSRHIFDDIISFDKIVFIDFILTTVLLVEAGLDNINRGKQ